MDIKVEITSITHEDLVNLLSTAFYGSEVFAPKLLDEWKPLENREENECFEDKMANVLRYGGWVCAIDIEGEEVYENKGVFSRLRENGDGEYHFDIEAVRIGLKRAIESKENYVRTAAFNFLIDDGTFDATDADILLQMILFGEVIYG